MIDYEKNKNANHSKNIEIEADNNQLFHDVAKALNLSEEDLENLPQKSSFNINLDQEAYDLADTILDTSNKNEDEFDLSMKFADPELQENFEWKEITGLDEISLCGAIETVLFLSDRPVSLSKLRSSIGISIPLRSFHEAISKLQEEYEQKHHGLRLQEIADGYQFRTKPIYSRFAQDFFKMNTLVLAPTALEVLAIIAYRGPVSRIDIENIRGVDSSHIVRALMDKKLVKVAGRSEDVGRPVLYGVTNDFMEVFGLKDLNELPPEYELESMLDKSQAGKISDIKTIISKGSKEKFFFDEIEELDELQNKIKNIDPETEFIKLINSNLNKELSDDQEPRKSAFDLLEEMLEKQKVIEQNRQAQKSELLTSIADPKVIKDLLFDLNAPDPEDSFEFNEMSQREEHVEIQNKKLELDDQADDFDDLFNDGLGHAKEHISKEDKEKFAKALESAHKTLHLNNHEIEENSNKFNALNDKDQDQEEDFANLDNQILKLKNAQDQLAQKAKEMDLDLKIDIETDDL